MTDGTTLLGADDKAGVAEILSAAELLLASNLPHGTVKIAFTPDEEIGEGADHFDVSGFGAEYAYTVDGGAIGELEYENFNAASALVEIAAFHPSGLGLRQDGKRELSCNGICLAAARIGNTVFYGRLRGLFPSD